MLIIHGWRGGIRRGFCAPAAAMLLVMAAPVRAIAEVAVLVTEHVDLRVTDDPGRTNRLGLEVVDEDRRVVYPPEQVVLVANERARLILPAGTPFGEEGADFFALPQSQDPDLLYLGVSAEGLSVNTFADGPSLRLKSIEGPGRFFVWQASAFGDLDVRIDSGNGVGNEDALTPIAGSHEHANWGFTSPGVYKVTFEVHARIRGETTNRVSLPAPVTFHVRPLPQGPGEVRAARLAEGGHLDFEVVGTPGAVYTLESSDDLRAWTEAGTVAIPAFESVAPVTWPVRGARLFARVRRLP